MKSTAAAGDSTCAPSLPGARTRAATAVMPSDAHLSGLVLRVRDLELERGFYQDALGLAVVDEEKGRLRLAPGKRAFTLTLVNEPDAPLRPPSTIGLYHFALLFPDRAAVGSMVRHLHRSGVGFDGFADHGVSEACYLADPEGNGIELYADRPKTAWPYVGGELAMTTRALDLDKLLAEGREPSPIDPATRLGHIHLHVPSLAEAERFYAGELGLDVTARGYPGALFFSAGGYHHHVGANVWAGERRAPPDATGLLSYGWRVSGLETARTLTDPAGVEVRLAAD